MGWYKIGDTIYTEFTTSRFDTGAATNADSLPTGVVNRNGSDTTVSVTITNVGTGRYSASFTPTSSVFANEDEVILTITAIVNSVTGTGKVWEGSLYVTSAAGSAPVTTATSLTPAKLLRSVREQFSEATASFNTDLGIYAYMWAGETELANLIPCAEGTDTTLTTTATTREYSLPAWVQRIQKVLYNAMPLKKIDMKELDMLELTSYGSTGSSGNPIYYYEWDNKIGLSPIPTEAKGLTIYYMKEPAEITAASTAFTVPSWMAQYIVDYCLYRMYLKDSDRARADIHLQLWVRNKQSALNEWTKRTSQNRIRIVKDENDYVMGTI